MNTNNSLNNEQIKELLEPFDHNMVNERESDNQLIVPHDYVRGRLSEIFGPLGWSEQTLELTEVPTGDAAGALKYVAYRARVRVIIRNPDGTPGAFWDGAGAWGSGRDVRQKRTAIWDLHSDCMNGALSVAFLRATKNLGNQFGLCLYTPDPAKRPGYVVRDFLTHPLPSEYAAGDGEQTQPELDMNYTADPEGEEHPHEAP